MAKRIAVSTLNATSLDIINTIRANASYEYQSQVPKITRTEDIPKVGEILYGTPSLANQFINALVNRIAMVRIKSANFNNPYSALKKGYLEFGEVVEEVFVNITKAREFSAEKAADREFRRSLPDVRTAFHTMNWRVQYPITIQDEDLRMAFTSASGMQDLIAKIISAVYNSAEYDEYLLFKYLIIKAVSHGKMYPVAVGDGTDLKVDAVEYRAMSNQLTFMSDKYNDNGVTTITAKADQYIFMDAHYNAQFDVNVLASAFNMDKADFMGRLHLIDDFTTFDMDRFSIIMENSSQIEAITEDELALMKDVRAVLVDSEWFQIWDNQNKMTEQYVASGEYWNYFYNTWKTVSSSPFSNAIVFVGSNADIELPTSVKFKVGTVDTDDIATVVTLIADESTPALTPNNISFIQTEEATDGGVAIQKYGVVMFPKTATDNSITLEVTIGGETYTAGSALAKATVKTGDEITFTKG